MTATPTSQRHMIEALTENFDSIVKQAADRDKNVSLSVESYIQFRRINVATPAFFTIMEFGLDLPDEVFQHPVIADLCIQVTDMILLDNVRWQVSRYMQAAKVVLSYVRTCSRTTRSRQRETISTT